MKKEKNIKLTADAVIISGGKVLLLKRRIPPFKGSWVLPGGHVEYGERVEEAVKREVFEETGLKVEGLQLIGVYSSPERDPRGHTVSCAYLMEVDDFKDINLNEEASEFGLFDFSNLPEPMGFDHRKIIDDSGIFLEK